MATKAEITVKITNSILAKTPQDQITPEGVAEILTDIMNLIPDDVTTLSGNTLTLPDGQSIVIEPDTKAIINSGLITFADGQTADLGSIDTDTFATILNGVITTPDGVQHPFSENDTFAVFDGGTEITFADGQVLSLSQAGSTGLEKIDEGNGQGLAIIGRNPNNYGNIGLNAVDLSTSRSPFDNLGATGEESFSANTRSRAQGMSSASFNSSRADGVRSFSSGNGSRSIGAESFSAGQNTRSNSLAEFSIGINGTDTPGNTNDFVPTDRVFNVGNGAPFQPRSDAFTIYKNGSAVIHPVDISSITNAQAGMIIIDSSDANSLKFHDGSNWQKVSFFLPS